VTDDGEATSDEALCRRIAARDDAAFDVLVARYQARAYRLAWSFLRNAEDARDVSQDAFIRVWEAAERFRGDARFSTWFYRILVNACLDHKRRGRWWALRVARDRLQRGRLASQTLLLADLRELRDDALVRDPTEVEALRARDDRRRDLPGFGRREHEDRVRRRLLQRLQQRVEGLARQLVGFVDDIDLVLALRRRETHLVAEVAHLVDTAIGRGVDLDEVEEGPLADRDAVLAAVAGLAVLRLGAVHRLRDEPRDRRLADAARPREEIRVRDLARADRIPQRTGDVLLPDDRGEGLGAIAAIEGRPLGHPSRIVERPSPLSSAWRVRFARPPQ